MVGFLLVFLSMFFIMVCLVASLSLSKKEIVLVPKNSLLYLKFDVPIPDRSSNNPFENFDFQNLKNNNNSGLNDILKNIKKAANDKNIKGIYLDLANIPAGISTIEEIRNALLEFKKSKKFIISYSEEYSQKSYYLASVADKIYLNPQGSIDFRGLNGQIMFLKGMLKKIDVDVQVIRHGKFKSAVEPFLLDKMSEANKEQTLKYINSIWEHILDGISASRNISKEDLIKIADSVKVRRPEDAVKYKFADKLVYKDELLAELRSKLGIGKNDNISTMTLSKYDNVPDESKKNNNNSKDKIAIIYASGNIISGKGDDKSIASETTSEVIRKARLDSSIKAIVLRVNSRGGSALASDVIWREVALAKKAKPVVVSMGDYAASGGYYISCAASKIVADPNTITGSIGVFGIIPNLKGFFNNKLGITFDNVKTNTYADFGTGTRALTESEKNICQSAVEETYKTFITHVAEGRGLTAAHVDSIAQGRVWTGADAKNIGLVDELGGIDKAVEIAAKLAKLKDYKIKDLPEQKEPFKQIIEELLGTSDDTFLKNQMGDFYEYYDYMQSVKNMKGVQARLPYDIVLE